MSPSNKDRGDLEANRNSLRDSNTPLFKAMNNGASSYRQSGSHQSAVTTQQGDDDTEKQDGYDTREPSEHGGEEDEVHQKGEQPGEQHQPPPASEQAEQSDIVDWDGPQDPANPMNWSKAKKWWITMITALMTFVVSFGSSVFSTATAATAEQFGVSQEVMILGVTLYVLGFACGPLVWGPLSELYGRRKPLMAGMIGFIIFQIPVGVAGNLQTIFICRFFGGAFGSAPLAIVAGIYVDFWDPIMRAIATMAYAAAVFAGPAVGPIVGEFTVKNSSLGWHWTAWFTMIMAAFFTIPALFTVPESLAPILLREKAARLRVETKNWALHSKLEEEPIHLNYLLQKYALKPFQMLFYEPILIVMTLYISLVYGILYLIFFAYPLSFEYDRGITFGISSLPFIAIFLGVLVACIYMACETKYVFHPKFLRAKKLIPEERLPPMMVGSVVLVIGLFWFAFTSYPSISPWPQIVSGLFIGCGIIMVFMPAIIYLVDVYLFDANSALAANAFVRSFVAAAFPLFATYMYERLGVQWASALLGFLCLALVPAPFLFYKYGKAIRSKSRFAYDLG